MIYNVISNQLYETINTGSDNMARKLVQQIGCGKQPVRQDSMGRTWYSSLVVDFVTDMVQRE
jgi:hypothetical protein